MSYIQLFDEIKIEELLNNDSFIKVQSGIYRSRDRDRDSDRNRDRDSDKSSRDRDSDRNRDRDSDKSSCDTEITGSINDLYNENVIIE